MTIQIQRVYDVLDGPKTGTWFLVDRLWPRGVKKERLPLDGWLPELAPSNELRKWFAHDPARWEEFQHRYSSELMQSPDRWKPIVEASQLGNVTLLFSARDVQRNNAVALKLFIEKQLKH